MNQLGIRPSKVLVISPHPDDGIIGCGGTIVRLLEEKCEVIYLILSWDKQGFNKEEIIDAVKELGVKEDNIILLDYEVRKFPNNSETIREELINAREIYKPDLVFVHSSNDIHQDHEICSKETFRVFREGIVFGYMLPWNLRRFNLDIVYCLEEKHVERKVSSMEKLISQKLRFYYDSSVIRALAKTMGLFRRRKYAEAFEILSIVT